MAETTLNEGMAKGKDLCADELKSVLNDLAYEIGECAGVTDMLTAYLVGASIPEGQMENHLLSILNMLTRRLNDMAQKADRRQSS